MITRLSRISISLSFSLCINASISTSYLFLIFLILFFSKNAQESIQGGEHGEKRKKVPRPYINYTGLDLIFYIHAVKFITLHRLLTICSLELSVNRQTNQPTIRQTDRHCQVYSCYYSLISEKLWHLDGNKSGCGLG